MVFKPEEPGVNCLRMEVSLSAAILRYMWRNEGLGFGEKIEGNWGVYKDG